MLALLWKWEQIEGNIWGCAMRVSDVLRDKGTDVISVCPTNTLEDVLAVLTEYRIGAVVVLEGSRLVGILSERDVVDALARHGAAALTDTAAQLMTVPTQVCEPGDAIDSLMATMTNERVRHLPVVHGDMVVGMISIGDVVKRRVIQLESDAEQLSSYITSGR